MLISIFLSVYKKLHHDIPTTAVQKFDVLLSTHFLQKTVTSSLLRNTIFKKMMMMMMMMIMMMIMMTQVIVATNVRPIVGIATQPSVERKNQMHPIWQYIHFLERDDTTLKTLL